MARTTTNTETTEEINETIIPDKLEKSKFEELRNKELKLIRCRIVNNNPDCRDLQGKIYTVGNTYLGMVSKYIPFTSPASDSYHIPYILLKALRRRKYSAVSTVKNNQGSSVNVIKDYPEFSIVELPPLTKEELAALAEQQTLSKSID